MTTRPRHRLPRRRSKLGRRRFGIAGLVAIMAFLAATPSALAHEFGPFAINRYAALLIGPDGIELDYVVDLAETPTQADGDRVEADPIGFCLEMLDNITFTIEGTAVELGTPTASATRFDGDGGLTTLRVECNWTTEEGAGPESRSATFTDVNYRERVGWREILVVGDRTVIDGDVTDRSVTDRLTDFPGADENPDAVSVEFSFTASADAPAATLDKTEPGDDNNGDAFAGLITRADDGALSMIGALAFAALLGALHSLAPGHGKTVIGAYLVGTKGTKLQAFVLAIAVALSHTLGVLILGIVTYAAGSAFAPERVYPWLQAVSALIVFGIGIWLVVTAFRERRARQLGTEPPHHHQLHAHGHFQEEHDHRHDEASDLDHVPPLVTSAAVAVATGSVAVLPHDHPHSDHSHGDHDHPHSDHDHPHDHPHSDHDHPHDHPHSDHDHDHDHSDHDHGDHDHDHPTTTRPRPRPPPRPRPQRPTTTTTPTATTTTATTTTATTTTTTATTTTPTMPDGIGTGSSRTRTASTSMRWTCRGKSAGRRWVCSVSREDWFRQPRRSSCCSEPSNSTALPSVAS